MEGHVSTQDLTSTSVPVLRVTLVPTVRGRNMPVCPIHAPMEGAAQKPVKATNVSARQAGAAPPALLMWTTALQTPAIMEAPARIWSMVTSVTVLHSGQGRHV